MSESDWKQLKLSLERPYKNDHGAPIPNVLDILPDGEHIYEPQEGPGAKLGDHLRRLFQERGLDFFEQDAEQRRTSKASQDVRDQVQDTEADEALESHEGKSMTPEELHRMRMEILPQLHTSLGEMSLARDVLAMFLSYSTPPAPNEPTPPIPLPTGLTSSLVSRSQAVSSVQAFNAQLAVGGKDEALRKAASLFKSAAESVDRGCTMSDRYWMDALRIRRRNWGLVPAPLPYGAPMGRGADKTTKDFLISYGLEESPPAFRRRALGHLASQDLSSDPIVFPHRQKIALRISLKTIDPEGKEHVSYNQLSKEDAESLDGILRHAQREVVEQEVFAALIRDAGNLPTTSARVSERLIVIEAAQDTELSLELVDETTVDQSVYEATEGAVGQATCNLIYSLLQILLLRSHSYAKTQRLDGSAIRKGDGLPDRSPRILQTVIDLLQYHMFCNRIKREMQKIVSGLRNAGVPTKFRFNAVGETGEELVRMLGEGGEGRVGGEAIIRVDNSRTLRFTFHSPSSLTAHMSQATLQVSSITQLVQLLHDEIEQCLLQRICEVGRDASNQMNGVWFVDLLVGRSVGKWEGCVMNFRISYGDTSIVHCSVSRLARKDRHTKTDTETFIAGQSPFFVWIRESIQRALVTP